MATINPNKQFDYLAENELLDEQLNILKDIGKLLSANKNIIGASRKSLSAEIKSLSTEKDFLEQINKINSVGMDIRKAHRNISIQEKSLNTQIINATAAGNNVKLASLNLTLKRIQAERDFYTAIQSQISLAEKNAGQLQKQHVVLSSLQQKTQLASAMGFSKYTHGVSSLFNKIAILQGKNVVGATTVLKIFDRWYYPLIISVGLLSKIWELFKELDKSAWESRKSFGMMRKEHSLLRDQAENIYKQYANLGITTDIVYKTQKAISNELGSILYATRDLVSQVGLMSSQFGIAEETSTRFLKIIGQLGKTSAETQLHLMGFAGALSNASGVPLPQVMEDVSKASEVTRTMMSKLPLDMIKAAVEARRMGTTLDKMASSSRGILNFTESIAAEMEASVLVGYPINLQLARQLGYHGKIIESNKEILRLSKQIGFEGLDIFSMEAFAKATNKSVDEIKNMIQADREFIGMRNKALTDKTLAKRIRDMEQLKNANESVAKTRGNDWNMMVKQQANQERIVSITNAWKKVVMEIGYVFLPIVDDVLKLAATLIPVVGTMMKISLWAGGVYGAFKALGALLTGVGKSFMFIDLMIDLATNGSKKLGWIQNVLFKAFSFFTNIGKGSVYVANLFGWISKLSVLSPFVKWVPVIGWVLTGVQFLYSWIKKLIVIFNDDKMNFGQKILAGIKAVGSSLYEVLIQPFKDAWDWMKERFFGKSPSKLGLFIVKGIKSVGRMMLESLLSPFKMSWDFIKNLFSFDIVRIMIDGMKSAAEMMFDSIIAPYKRAWEWISNKFGKGDLTQQSLQRNIIHKKAAEIAIPLDRQITTDEVKSYRELGVVPVSQKQSTSVSSVNSTNVVDTTSQALLAEIKGLRADLLAGNIAVNLDGQLVSTTMNRGIKFRGQYGAIM